MKEYSIKYEPVINGGNKKDCYNIYYYIDGEIESVGLYAFDLNNPVTYIREGYSKKVISTDIEVYRKNLIDYIDERSQNIIFEGFPFDGNTFSLSYSAQINWLGLMTVPHSMFPINLSTKNDDIYVLQLVNLEAFYGAALNGKNAPLQEGNLLKIQVKAATTIKELDDIYNSIR